MTICMGIGQCLLTVSDPARKSCSFFHIHAIYPLLTKQLFGQDGYTIGLVLDEIKGKLG